MFGTIRPKDHSNKQIKFLLRQVLLPRIRPRVGLDLFAGRGEIASRFYLDFEELHCVEKNPKSFAFLQKRLGARLTLEARVPSPALPLIHLHRGDNLKFLADQVAGIRGINLADFDACGSPNPQIKQFFKSYRVTEPMLIFATDGGKLALLRGAAWHPDWYSAREPEGPPVARYHSLVARDYELLIRRFWQEMAVAYGFSIQAFQLCWKQERLLAYYGLYLEPA
ncbi:MAG: hypothetical protein A2V67_20585 [Deltaproteobacteria bacterium RBG_13_61_14]|nr:MAG: hypothetical protein A2V67_20585 [Deltaproteobacteria bacterium RBG_13_61_14]